jgi:hypothetical protein
MFLQAVRLSGNQGTFAKSFSPLDLVDEVLEREGEFTQWSGNTISFGDLSAFDALSRRPGDLPLLNKDNSAGDWELQHSALIAEAHMCLSRFAVEERVETLLRFLRAASHAGIEARGFRSIVHSFSEDRHFTIHLADRIAADQAPSFVNELAAAFDQLHLNWPSEFHRRARSALASEMSHLVVAASAALRINNNATIDDARLIT